MWQAQICICAILLAAWTRGASVPGPSAQASLPPRADDAWSVLDQVLAPTTLEAFLRHDYRRNLRHVRATSSRNLSSLDPWIERLCNVDAFMGETFSQLRAVPGAVQYKTATGSDRPLPPTPTWTEEAPRFYASGESMVLRREATTAPLSDLELALQTVFHTTHSTVHAYISSGGAQALPYHTDSYDVIVLQVSGVKKWTICQPPSLETAWPNPSPADLAQLYELRHANPDGCSNFNHRTIEQLNCQNLTMLAGDMLYLPKSMIHVAHTKPGTVSAHLTYSLDREGGMWRDVISRACSTWRLPLCPEILGSLQRAKSTDAALPWLQLAYEPVRPGAPVTSTHCLRLYSMVFGKEFYSLASLLSPRPGLLGYLSTLQRNWQLAILAECHAEQAGYTMRSFIETPEASVSDVRMRRNVFPYNPPCNSNGGYCLNCYQSSCNNGCSGIDACDGYVRFVCLPDIEPPNPPLLTLRVGRVAH
ncbi:uncharacterized protein MONBRDRAFT_5112 [Monosiga brevicollis MX1]|uniref:Bifunctional lysine-specific demethylase and histidyl-hydroxylase n=1 Tax=Monosiga brevicollis TaxID=81824 RepID=A9UPY7_MONBE|nr:uncharacterized protein MONBRDRAFT_5112 [Monosiga brevicollis MX1]EDQ92502.1 predicted protein [Monosiga brevicollis MX1]|eukprot:XP_001742264.1 hypothetical protein [Monosiga brevicollis MX1]